MDAYLGTSYKKPYLRFSIVITNGCLSDFGSRNMHNIDFEKIYAWKGFFCLLNSMKIIEY